VASAASARAAGSAPALLFDSDCGFCRWTLGWVLRWDTHRRVIPLAIQDPAADGPLAGLEPEKRLASWHFVDSEGELHSAGAAFAPLFELLPCARPLAALTRRAPRLTERAYRSVTSRRSTLGRLVTRAARERADQLIAERRRARS
jgi:predicted DCC family thiol-disulfide oxidoreductase YuxK